MLVQLLQDGQRLFGEAVLQDALDDPAAVRVSGQSEDLRGATSHRELAVFWGVFLFSWRIKAIIFLAHNLRQSPSLQVFPV